VAGENLNHSFHTLEEAIAHAIAVANDTYYRYNSRAGEYFCMMIGINTHNKK
jgi:hypothetical protein